MPGYCFVGLPATSVVIDMWLCRVDLLCPYPSLSKFLLEFGWIVDCWIDDTLSFAFEKRINQSDDQWMFINFWHPFHSRHSDNLLYQCSLLYQFEYQCLSIQWHKNHDRYDSWPFHVNFAKVCRTRITLPWAQLIHWVQEHEGGTTGTQCPLETLSHGKRLGRRIM